MKRKKKKKSSWKSKLADALTLVKGPARELATALLLLLTMTYMAMKAPEMHEAFLRMKVGSRTFTVQIAPNGGGGTGFQVKTPSGKNYLLTNDHICAAADGDTLYVTGENGETLPRKIIERSDFTDLCLVEAMPGVEGLSIGKEPGVGEHVSVVGHPLLEPLTVTEGQITGKSDVAIPDFEISEQNSVSDCNKPKNKVIEVPLNFFGTVIGMAQVCAIVTSDAYQSTATIFPGNSGSPVVDFWGRVVGVAFASDDTNWARIVNISDVVKFLSKY